MTSIYKKIFVLILYKHNLLILAKACGGSDWQLQNIFYILMESRVKPENYFLFGKVFLFNQHFN